MTEKKKPKLDIKRVLGAIDRKDRDFYNRCDPEERKALNFYMLQRYVSSSQNLAEHHLYFTNLFSNRGMMAETGITRHPELQWLSLCAVGTGKPQFHPYVKPPGAKKKKDRVFDALRDINPLLKNDEIELIVQINTTEELRELFESNGYDDKTIKEIFGKR